MVSRSASAPAVGQPPVAILDELLFEFRLRQRIACAAYSGWRSSCTVPSLHGGAEIPVVARVFVSGSIRYRIF
jgi:hypothetical protein